MEIRKTNHVVILAWTLVILMTLMILAIHIVMFVVNWKLTLAILGVAIVFVPIGLLFARCITYLVEHYEQFKDY